MSVNQHRSFEQNEDFYLEHDSVGLQIPGIPPLRFFSPPQLTLYAPEGSLHLITYIPGDDTSLNHFHALAAISPLENVPLSPYPIQTQWIEDEDEEDEDEPETETE